MRYACCHERRLLAVQEADVLNGLAYVEVSDSEAPQPALRQRTLFLRLLAPDPALAPVNVTITGGERIASVAVEWVAPATALPAGEDPALVDGLEDPATVVLVRTASRGDFSLYTLRLVAGAGNDAPPAGFDARLTDVEFSFKVDCPSDFDCAPACDCPPPAAQAPDIDYLAKDFSGFRRLILDRLSLLAPQWRERSPADVGVTLVEALAYVADELSYRQDAVATEAYLGTARRRTSLRRHARLVDYVVHDGASARAWVQVRAATEGVALAAHTALLTRVPGAPDVLEPDSAAHRAALAAGTETFETMEEAVLDPTLEHLQFWAWGDTGCCLPRGATAATLVGEHPNLKAGDVLVLAEVASPTTGKAQDADPAKRAAVRLTSVVSSSDPAGGLFAVPPTAAAVAVTEIAWDAADALPFALCVSVEQQPGLVISEAWGSVVLADHGRTIAAEPLGAMPVPVLSYVGTVGCEPCAHEDDEPVPARFRPTLAGAPVTQARPAPTAVVAQSDVTAGLAADLAALTFSPLVHDWLQARGFSFAAGPAVVRGGHDVFSVSDGVTVALLRLQGGTLSVLARPASATATTAADPRAARPAITLDGTLLTATEPWRPQSDLLGSDGDAAEFVVEIEDDGTATLRFGDGVHGRRPQTDTSFTATYRVGNGANGNVGAGAIAHVVTSQADVLGASNRIAAAGGTEPEAADAVRRDAPQAFLVQQRAVTAEDYAEVAQRDPGVQRAAASFRWTGSWHTVFLTADRSGGLAVDEPFETGVRAFLEPFRMAGYDLEVDAPRFVALEVGLLVCAAPAHFRAHVKAAVLDVLSSGVRADRSLGFFHPDRFTFAQPVYLSAIVAAAQAVTGVDSVAALVFQRQRDNASSALDSGVLSIGRLEIARLDNDPSFPEHGVLELTMGGGK